MDKLYIISNWKSNKTLNDAKTWLEEIGKLSPNDSKEIIVCPPFTLLDCAKTNLPEHIKLAAQDVSPFSEGAYTGEVSAKQIKEFADYVLIGHSERRENFNETDEMLQKKVQEALKNSLTPIFLVQGKENKIPNGVDIIAYEPLFAIGSGNPETPSNADEVASFYKETSNIKYVLYGGSVNSENVSSFTKTDHIDGVLVGSASLDASEFIGIVENA